MTELTIIIPSWFVALFAVLIVVHGSLDIAKVVLDFIKAKNEKRFKLLKLLHEKEKQEARNPLENPMDPIPEYTNAGIYGLKR